MSILDLITGWRAARHAQTIPELRGFRDIYERMERDYAMVIRRRLGR